MSRANATDWPTVTISEHAGVRYLHLDTPWVQGAMRLAKPDAVELEYVRRMLASLLWRPVDEMGTGRAVQLGLGAAAITRFTHGQLGLDTTAIELNPGVMRACRMWFRLPPDGPRLRVLCEDAGHWIARKEQASRIDLLHVDLYDHEAAAPVLDSEAFYAHCHAALAPGGVMAVNLFGRLSSFERSAQRIMQAFGRGQTWRVQPTREGNTVVVATRGVTVPDRETLLARARWIEERLGLPATKWLRMIRPL
ncbi:MAG: spermidine synthase [Burkholderiaceae bacterium]